MRVAFGQNQWRKVIIAIAVGMCVGVAAAALNVSHRTDPELTSVVTPVPYILPVSNNASADTRAASLEPTNAPGTLASFQQIERLKTRNRRLEALVSVLRQRTAEHK